MSVFEIKSYAKINLSLQIKGKFKSNLHKIESLITFVNLNDQIKIIRSKNSFHKVTFYGKFSKGISQQNTITKLLKILDARNLLKGKKYLIKVKKNIPLKSGLGGGSMNAASILKYFLDKKVFFLKKNEVKEIPNQVGSDVIVGMKRYNTILLSNGDTYTSKKKLRLYTIIVKPNFGCSTRAIYQNVKIFSKKKYKKVFDLKNIMKLKNDLEGVVFSKYSIIKNISICLKKLPRVNFVRMTGSGSCLVAYFNSRNASINAAKIFRRNYKKYWCIVSKTI